VFKSGTLALRTTIRRSLSRYRLTSVALIRHLMIQLQPRPNRPYPFTQVTSSLATSRACPLQFRRRTSRRTQHPVIYLTTKSCRRSVYPEVTLLSELSLLALLLYQPKKRWKPPSASIGRIEYRLLRDLKTKNLTRMRGKIL